MKTFNDKDQYNYQENEFSFVRKIAYHINFIYEIVR